MILGILSCITILLYSIIVSQSFSYLIFLEDVQLQMEATEYIRFRKLTDVNFNRKFKPVTYLALLAVLSLCILSFSQGMGFFSLCLAGLVLLLADAVIALKKSLPINAVINEWNAAVPPKDWSAYRGAWLRFFHWRMALNITGFACVLVAILFFR